MRSFIPATAMALALVVVFVFIVGACKNPVKNSREDSREDMSGKIVVLVHGYGKDSDDMRSLANFLGEAGYRAVKVDLPLTFDSVDEAAKIFEQEVAALLSTLADEQPIAMVGHSTGGLVIRYFLSHSPLYQRVDRAVLIATPNRGSTLAEMAGDLSGLLVETFATLDSLRPEKISRLALHDPEEALVGAIAGDKGNLVLGGLLEKENDGRVEVESVFYPELDDFIVVPHNHHEIHHSRKTASLVIRFIETGSFENPS